MTESVHATADVKNVKVYLGRSGDDDSIYATGKGLYGDSCVFPSMLPTAHKWNALAEIALENPEIKLFMLGADDMVFETPGWDKALIDHYNALENKIHVYHLQDSRSGDGNPHPIVTREYIAAMGYFVPPIFLHWFVDTWTCEIARANSCYSHLKDYKLTHIKPSDEGKPDTTHSRIRDFGWHERDKWVSEKMAHVLELEKQRLMSIIVLKGKITHHGQKAVATFGYNIPEFVSEEVYNR